MPISASERTFGIEVETLIPNTARHLFERGQHTTGPQIEALSPGWQSRTDNSIRAREPGYFGIEVVSPILVGPTGLADVVRTVNWLRAVGAQSNDTTGLHVHAGADDLDGDQVRSVRRAFVLFEQAFLALNGDDTANRRDNRYCTLSCYWPVRASFDDDRYRSLNLSNWQQWAGGARNARPTLECRIWQTTLSDTKVVAAISMFIALVTKAAMDYTPMRIIQIGRGTDAMRAFIHEHYSRKARKAYDLRIATTAPISDVCLAAWHEVKRGEKSR